MLRHVSVRASLALRSHHRLSLRTARKYATEPSTNTSRIARIESRLPRFLHRILTPLRNAPVSHITSFIILHEITAVAPIFALAAAFHYSNWLPPYLSEGKWVHEGMEKFGRLLKKWGWIKDENKSGKWWGRGEGGARVVVEFATAYAITKALLPVRLLVSVWMTPWFARWTVLPIMGSLRRLFWRTRGVSTTKPPAAGTNAVGPRVVPKDPSSHVK